MVGKNRVVIVIVIVIVVVVVVVVVALTISWLLECNQSVKMLFVVLLCLLFCHVYISRHVNINIICKDNTDLCTEKHVKHLA